MLQPLKLTEGGLLTTFWHLRTYPSTTALSPLPPSVVRVVRWYCEAPYPIPLYPLRGYRGTGSNGLAKLGVRWYSKKMVCSTISNPVPLKGIIGSVLFLQFINTLHYLSGLAELGRVIGITTMHATLWFTTFGAKFSTYPEGHHLTALATVFLSSNCHSITPPTPLTPFGGMG